MTKFYLAGTVLLLKVTLILGQDCDACKDILPLGFYNKTNISNTGNFASDVKNWLLSDNFRKDIHSWGGGVTIGIPIDGVPIQFGGNANESSYNEVKDYLNKGNTSTINQSFANYIAQQVVDPNVVAAWSKCMGDCSQKTGLQGSIAGEKNGDYFNLLLYWVSRLNVNSCKVSNISIYGASYDTTLLKYGLEIGSEIISIPIVRKGNNTINITINTIGNIGSVFKTIDKKNLQPVTPQKTSAQKCLEDNDPDACLKAAADMESECNKKYSNRSLNQSENSQYLNCLRAAQQYKDLNIAVQQLNDAIKQFGANSSQVESVRQRIRNIKTPTKNRGAF